uniref:Uncharacterized protein n=1 Tax=Rhizochromulina marina TaxID=1034831 RepID=A0A7S2S8E9_9STRA
MSPAAIPQLTALDQDLAALSPESRLLPGVVLGTATSELPALEGEGGNLLEDLSSLFSLEYEEETGAIADPSDSDWLLDESTGLVVLTKTDEEFISLFGGAGALSPTSVAAQGMMPHEDHEPRSLLPAVPAIPAPGPGAEAHATLPQSWLNMIQSEVGGDEDAEDLDEMADGQMSRLRWRAFPDMFTLAVVVFFKLYVRKGRRPTAPEIVAQNPKRWEKFGVSSKVDMDKIRRQLAEVAKREPKWLPQELEGIGPLLKFGLDHNNRLRVSRRDGVMSPSDRCWWPATHPLLDAVICQHSRR